MLRVVGPGFTNRYGDATYQTVRCVCDCGTEINIPYAILYQRKYSCGCTRRPSSRTDGMFRSSSTAVGLAKEQDYTGLTITHDQTGRTISIESKIDGSGPAAAAPAAPAAAKTVRDMKTNTDRYRIICLECGDSKDIGIVIQSRSSVPMRIYLEAGRPCWNPKCVLAAVPAEAAPAAAPAMAAAVASSST